MRQRTDNAIFMFSDFQGKQQAFGGLNCPQCGIPFGNLLPSTMSIYHRAKGSGGIVAYGICAQCAAKMASCSQEDMVIATSIGELYLEILLVNSGITRSSDYGFGEMIAFLGEKCPQWLLEWYGEVCEK